jgi:hypothetical protein
MVAVSATGPEIGLQSRWYREHRSPHAPDPPEPGETPVSPGSNQVKVQFHLVQRRADLHDQLKLSRIASRLLPAGKAGRPNDLDVGPSRDAASAQHQSWEFVI